MDEEKKETQEIKEEQEKSEEDIDKRVQPETTSLIDKADAAAERIEKANIKQEELLNRQEQLMAKQALGGKSEAGKPYQEEKKEMSDEEYAKALQKGEVNPFKE